MSSWVGSVSSIPLVLELTERNEIGFTFNQTDHENPAVCDGKYQGRGILKYILKLLVVS